MKDNIIILAGGKSTRMKMNTNKCALPLLKKPLISHLAETINKVHIKNKIVVLGYEGNTIKTILGDFANYVYQEEQLGSGHATSIATSKLDYDEELTFIVCGDMPLIKQKTLTSLRDYHLYNKNDITVVSTIVEDPKKYGRLVKDYASNLIKIVEYKDASNEELEIREINTGIYCINTYLLPVLLSLIDNNNASKEYYLTDLIGIAYKNSYIFHSCFVFCGFCCFFFFFFYYI